MAGSRTQPRKGSSKKGAPKRVPAQSGPAADGRPSEHAKEAFSEWGKAARYGAAALFGLIQNRREGRAERPSLLERLNPSQTEKGGRTGTAADKLLSKMGTPGKVASAFSLGSRVVERMRDGGGKDESEDGDESDGDAARADAGEADNGSGGPVPIPIQQSIEVAVPVRVAYGLSTRFEDYPDFVDRIDDVEEVDDTRVVFVAKLRGVRRRVEIEIVDERPSRRIDWRGTEGIEASGVVTFHPLAPRLTRIELSVELEREGLVDRLARAAHLTERRIHADLQRFKAYAELWEDEQELEDEFGVDEPEDEAELGEELEDEQELEDQADLEDGGELEDEEELEEGEYDEEEDEYDADEEDEEELEPARAGS